jgi:hypothetical protein
MSDDTSKKNDTEKKESSNNQQNNVIETNTSRSISKRDVLFVFNLFYFTRLWWNKTSMNFNIFYFYIDRILLFLYSQ